MILAENAAFRIGDWRIEPTLDEISRNRETVKLEPRSMRVLVCLAQHAGEVVSVERLLSEAWKDVVVTQDSVYQAIAGLRHALGDDSKEPAYIANVPRRGYRLIAPVAPADLAQVPAPLHNDFSAGVDTQGADVLPATRSILWWAGATLLAVAFLGALLWLIRWRQIQPALAVAPAGQTATQHATIQAATFAPPSHSVAVLPFVNISGDKEQEYFSDGLTDEVLNSLARINGLQVTGRTSAFYFKGEHADLTTVAHKLNVAAVLEGSVRRSQRTVRVSAQLVSAVTGFGLWSETYERDLGDVLKVQTEIATAVASALKVTLLRNETARIELGGTRNPAAFDAYLRASKAYRSYPRANNNDYVKAATALYTEAIRLDPNYALAYAARSIAHLEFVAFWVRGSAAADHLNKAQADARKAIALAPDLAEGHLALAVFFATSLDFRRANEEFERTVALDPGSGRILQNYGQFAVNMGHSDAGLAALRRAVALDPLNPSHHGVLTIGLRLARHYKESLAAYQEALSFFPGLSDELIGTTLYYSLGDFQKARSLCDSKFKKVLDEHPDAVARAELAACQYPNVSRDAAAETALKEFKASLGDDAAYDYVKIYAQWGDTATALEWLETALRLRAVGLQELKVEPLLDPLRNEPRFQAVIRQLKFPD